MMMNQGYIFSLCFSCSEKRSLLSSSRSSVLSRGTASNKQFPVAIQAIGEENISNVFIKIMLSTSKLDLL